MYSVVLATMMTITPAAPDHVFGLGCHGCYGCSGCWGYTSCYGCWGCYGCYGCYGSCYGCYGYTCHGCYGCSGCYGYTWYSYYCSGCCGTMMAPAQPPEKPKLPKPKDDKDKEEDVSKVTITAPADARLTVDGQPLVLQGTRQTFETPRLERGHTYSYVFRAEAMRDGKAVVRERKVTVRAGEAAQADFSDLVARGTARVTIVLPADAKLIVGDVSYPKGESKRTFETPQLEVGMRYTYTMRAEVWRDGQLLKQEKRVDVEAGKEITVEFKDLPAVQAAQR
jgi:uncharacterized protein (TIGR03000 family)